MKNRIGLGTFPLASVFNPISKTDAIKLVRQFIDAGGYYIDTAPLYGFGSVEKLLGEALAKYPREKYYVISKCGYIDVEGETFQTVKKSGKFKDVIRECERSLKRLNLEYLDLYFTHSPDPEVPFEETVEALTKLQKDGKIKEIGVSNVNLKELQRYNQTNKVKYIQNRFSLINRSIDPEFREYLIKSKIGLIPYQVIDRGQLTGSVFEGLQNLKDTDLRMGKPDWEEMKVNIIADWIKAQISPIAKELNITIGQLSIAWALHQDYLSFVIVGLTNPEYIPINLKANEIFLSEKIVNRIDKAYAFLQNEVTAEYGMSLREFRGLNEKYY